MPVRGLEDRLSGIEALGLRQLISSFGSRLRWVHSHAMLADGLTKNTPFAHELLCSFLVKGEWCLRFDERFLSARKRSAAGMDIFHPVEEPDVFRARKELERQRLAAAAARGTPLEDKTTSVQIDPSFTVQSEEEFSPIWKRPCDAGAVATPTSSATAGLQPALRQASCWPRCSEPSATDAQQGFLDTFCCVACQTSLYCSSLWMCACGRHLAPSGGFAVCGNLSHNNFIKIKRELLVSLSGTARVPIVTSLDGHCSRSEADISVVYQGYHFGFFSPALHTCQSHTSVLRLAAPPPHPSPTSFWGLRPPNPFGNRFRREV